jgi:hypothetical protein
LCDTERCNGFINATPTNKTVAEMPTREKCIRPEKYILSLETAAFKSMRVVRYKVWKFTPLSNVYLNGSC